MSILTNLQAQKIAMETIPIYGDRVDYAMRPSGESPFPQIYLSLPLAMQVVSENFQTNVTATWNAIVVAEPHEIIEEAITVQDKMVSAFLDSKCQAGAVERQNIEPRPEGAQTMIVSVSVRFGIREGN